MKQKLSLDNLPNSFGFTESCNLSRVLSLSVCVRARSMNKISNAIHELQLYEASGFFSVGVVKAAFVVNHRDSNNKSIAWFK